MANIYQNDLGTLVLITLGDINLASDGTSTLISPTVNLRKPDGETLIITPEVYAYSGPAKIYFLSDSTTFDQVGAYALQSNVQEFQFSDGTWALTKQWLGDLARFSVKAQWT